MRRLPSCVAPRQRSRGRAAGELSRRALRWALEAIVCQHLSVARVAEALAVSWNTANNAVLAEGRRVLIADPARFDGVQVIGVDEHVWRHTRRGDKYVTVIIDLTPVRDGSGPARLLDMVEGRSKQGSRPGWPSGPTLARRDRSRCDGRVYRLQDRRRRRAARRGRGDGPLPRRPAGRRRPRPMPAPRPARPPAGTAAAADPLYARRRTLHTGAELLTDKQKARLAPCSPSSTRRGRGHLGRSTSASSPPTATPTETGRTLMRSSTTISTGVPAALTEVITLGRTLKNAPPTCWPTSTGPAPATAPPKRSTAASSTSAAPPWVSATSPTTSPDHSWKPADSNPDYTVIHEEPY